MLLEAKVTEPLWIVFPGNMLIKLSQELIFNSYKTLDGRGANVHIVGGGCITLQFISNVIIHNVHIHNCYPSVDKFGSFLRQFPLFPNAFLVGGWCRRLLYYSTCRSGLSHWVLLLELFSWSWESYSSFSTSLQIQIVKTSAEDKKEHKPPLQLS
ncbi:uncharacterized protein LOC117626208 [Prunus dulcis]|uniref:uncharacterized protein LOC117626208 n=1 Tax=Prunus dulcis TaxID=3755 RepID=UPI001482E100|nr:uncharacterized protein LOC117626208 [Prunus dulcis]